MLPKYKNLLDNAQRERKANEHWARSQTHLKGETMLNELKAAHHAAFEQIDCLQCAHCCKTIPPLVTSSDIKRIASFLKTTPKQFTRKYVITDIDGEQTFSNVPCVFLGADNKCTIYEVRPEACRRYPHTDEVAYFQRPTLNIANTLVCPAAALVVNTLKDKNI
ncbi:MAG: YkgJ family cysteine cluster protein [Saprospiraceae bacterium]|nr:MAG: putative Fe-S oxidoreductase [Bacteroidetes bacterium OLB9]MCO6462654.1 YkgJ family cysteine cluster protein [Saprospiraceae bacterium]MCZ2337029.1 YkgJ family cysteine cluster protein [Chitinophagales bacterium]